jgi:hypothetical protein
LVWVAVLGDEFVLVYDIEVQEIGLVDELPQLRVFERLAGVLTKV